MLVLVSCQLRMFCFDVVLDRLAYANVREHMPRIRALPSPAFTRSICLCVCTDFESQESLRPEYVNSGKAIMTRSHTHGKPVFEDSPIQRFTRMGFSTVCILLPVFVQFVMDFLMYLFLSCSRW